MFAIPSTSLPEEVHTPLPEAFVHVCAREEQICQNVGDGMNPYTAAKTYAD